MFGARLRFVATGAAVTLAFAAALVSTSSVAVASPNPIAVAPADAGDTAATYTATFIAQNDLSAADTITLTTTGDTVFSPSASDYTISDNGTALPPVTTVVVGTNAVTIQITDFITSNDSLVVVAANATNPTTSGTYSADIADSGDGLVATGNYTIDPGVADATMTTISANPASVVANGTSTSTITVQAKDAYGNNLLTGGSEVFISTDLGTLNTALGNDNNDGTYTVTITSTTTGNATINGIIDGSAITATGAVSFTPVGSTTQTISFTGPSDTVFGTAPLTLSATATSGDPVTFSSPSTAVCTVSGTTLTLVGGGPCLINADQSGDATYAAATQVQWLFTVTPATQTITFGGPANTVFGTAPLTLVATATSGDSVTFSSPSTAVCTVSGTTLTLIGGGTCTIDADQSGDADYAAATQVEQQFLVTQAAGSVSAAPTSDTALTSGPVSVVASGVSSGEITFSTTSTACSVDSSGIVTLLAVGPCSITIDQAADANYTAATNTDSFNVTQGVGSVSATPISDTALTSGPVIVVASGASSGAISFSTISTACSVDGFGTVLLLAVGPCSITIDQAADVNYTAATTSDAFNVTQGVGSVSIGQTSSTAFTATPFTVVATGVSSGAITFTTLTTGVCTLSGSTVTLVGIGTCTIQAHQAADANYTAATDSDTFTVTQGVGSVSITPIGTTAFTGSPFTVVATGISTGAITFTSLSTGVCTVSGDSVTVLSGSGQCTIEADQAADANYTAATDTDSFAVVKGVGSVSIAQTPSTLLSDGSVAAVASGISSGAISITSLTTAVCTASGTTVTLAHIGTCTIQADQAADADYTAASGTDTFTVLQGTQTITFTQPNDILYGGSVTLAASADSGLPVTFTNAVPQFCSLSGDVATGTGIGTCSILLDQAGNADYAAAPEMSISFDVNQAGQTISFPQPTDAALSDSPVTVTATSDSMLAIAYSSNSTEVCDVDAASGVVTLHEVGTCIIDADQPGDDNFNAAQTVEQSFSVTQGSQTINFMGPTSTALSDGPLTLTATATSGLAVSFTSVTTGICTVTGQTVTLLAVGTCTIHADQAGDSVNWAAASTDSESFDVTQGSQVITFTQPPDTFYTGSDTLVASADSGLAVTFTSATTGVCTVSGTTVTAIGVGTCTINADQAGNANYAAAPTVTHSLNVAQATQAITFSQPANTALTAGSLTVSASANSGLTVTFSSATTPVCTVSGTTVTLVATGTCTINADQAGNADYSAATRVVDSFSVAGSGQTITFTQPSNAAFGTGLVTVTATSDSNLTVTFTSATTGICTVTGASVTLLGAGTCTIDADQAGNVNFAAAAQVAKSFTITQGTQTISFTGPANTALSAGPVAVTGTASSGLTVVFTSATTGICTVAGNSITLVATGTCTIHADQPGNGNWTAATTVPQSFTITPGAQTITFAAPTNHAYGTGPITVAATATSGLTVAFTSTTTAVCTVSGASVTLFTTGTCTLHADQAGNGNWTAATTVARSFTITAGAQTITFTAPADTALNGGPVTVSGAASSELAVAFTSVTTGVCTVSGNSVTLVAVGTCTIHADQEGDGNYASAATVSASFAVTAAVTQGGTPAAPVTPVVTASRIGGADRDDTAAQLSTAMYPTAGSAGVVVLARDDIYADGLTGSPLANALNGALLITPTSTLSAATLAALQHLLPAGGTVICLGGNAAIDPSVLTELSGLGYNVQRIAGADRYETATLIATRIFAATTITHIYLATGENFADALSAAGAAGLNHGVVLLTANTTMPAVTKAWIVAHPGLAITAIGGAAAAADPAATPIVGADRYATAAQVAASVAPTATGIVLATGTAFPDGLAGAAYAVHSGFSLLLVNPQATALGAAQASYLQTASATVSTVLTVGGTAAVPAAATGLITDGLS